MTVSISLQTQELLREQAGRLGEKPDALADSILLEALRTALPIRKPEQMRPSVLDVLADAAGHLSFQTAEDVDNYLSEERGAWEH